MVAAFVFAFFPAGHENALQTCLAEQQTVALSLFTLVEAFPPPAAPSQKWFAAVQPT
jgi:hypothetical protein